MPPGAKTDALVLRTRAYGESDKIVTFLTRDLGKISGIAKGAAKSKRRFSGALEPATEVRLTYRARSQSDLHFIEAAEILAAPRRLTRDLERYAFSTYVIEVLDCMIEGREAEGAVYDLARDVFLAIDAADVRAPGPELLRWFEVRLLTLCGFEPRLATCRRCGRATSGGTEPLRFDPIAGAVVCLACQNGVGIAISAPGVEAIRALRDAALPIAPLASPVAGEIRVLLQTFLQHHLRRPLKSPELLREILAIGG
jgi:DNA repair protein RecO (recombination protein O)